MSDVLDLQLLIQLTLMVIIHTVTDSLEVLQILHGCSLQGVSGVTASNTCYQFDDAQTHMHACMHTHTITFFHHCQCELKCSSPMA